MSKGSAHVQPHAVGQPPPHGTLGAVQKPIAEGIQAIGCHWREGGRRREKGPDAGGCRGNHIERPSRGLVVPVSTLRLLLSHTSGWPLISEARAPAKHLVAPGLTQQRPSAALATQRTAVVLAEGGGAMPGGADIEGLLAKHTSSKKEREILENYAGGLLGCKGGQGRRGLCRPAAPAP